jgi:CubicO group peptidase (beta-lactamase class C family)
MTKAITAAAAMQLIEQGKLSLDEPIGPHSGHFTSRIMSPRSSSNLGLSDFAQI